MHGRYNLGDKHNYLNNNDFLKYMLVYVLGNEKKAEAKYYEIKSGLKNSNDVVALNKSIPDFLRNSMIILPLYLYEHGDLAMSTESFFSNLVQVYEASYGPLTPMGDDGKNEWTWIKSPWPWE